MTEGELQGAVLECASLLRWRTAHFRPARTAHGWATPVSGDGKGFPDIVLVRDRVIWRELKGDGGRLRPEQEAWIEALRAAGEDAGVWRPDDWLTGQIEAELR